MTTADIRPASDHSILVSFGNEISPEVHRAVLRLTLLLKTRAGIQSVHPAYSTVLLTFDPGRIGHRDLEQEIRESLEQIDMVTLPEPRRVEIPVLYGGESGPDLDEVARLTCLTPEEVVRIHSSAEYLVYFIGFAPGFPYLGGMPETIAVPRLDVPRRQVPAGSVAIGGHQTGVYPVTSPGGWRLIGKTPLELFRPDRDPITLLQMGDHVRFVPIP